MKRTPLLSGIPGVLPAFGVFYLRVAILNQMMGFYGDDSYLFKTPTNVKVKALFPGSVLVSWDAAPEATSYKVYRADSNNGRAIM
jgi:hypothetical protein